MCFPPDGKASMKEKIKGRDIRNKIILYLVILVVVVPALVFSGAEIAMRFGEGWIWFYFVFFMSFAYYALRRLEKYLKGK